MKKVLHAAVGLWAGVALVGCGGSICDRAESTFKALHEKAMPCRGGGGSAGSFAFNKAPCDEAVKRCNANDHALLNAQLDCVDRVQACVKGEEMAWIGSVAACSKDSSKVTAACTLAVGPGAAAP